MTNTRTPSTARAADLGEKQTNVTAPGGFFKAVEALNERVRKRALRARTAVEGDAFTRFLTTEGAFCEQERASALAEFDEVKVPAALRALVPLARQLGVGDDACRAGSSRRCRVANARPRQS